MLSTVYFRGHNDNATTEQVDYAAVEGSIVSVTNNSENGQLSFKVQKSGTLTTQLAITNANVILSARPILPTASPESTGTGVTGEVTWDNGYFYVCTATNTWKKVGISTSGVPGSTSAFSSGSAASPSITFADDTNTGIFNPAADAVGISTGGTERLRVDSTGQIKAVSLGTAAAPTYTFTTDPDTGIYSPSANQLAISTNGTGRLFIDSSGRLLVGTSTARSNFFGTTLSSLTQTEGTGGSTARGALSVINNAVSNDPPYVLLGRSGAATLGSNAAVVSGSRLGTLTFHGADGTSFIEAATVAGEVDGTPGSNDMPGRLVLSTTLDGASSPTEALRITNDRVIAYNRDAPAAVNATATLTVANLKTGIITSTSAAATDMTLPTGTLTEGGFSGVYTNMTFEWSVINTGPSLVRVLAGTDHTIVGSGSVATGTSGRFASRRTAANTFVTYRLS